MNLSLSITLPHAAVANEQTRAVARLFEMESALDHPAPVGRVLLAQTAVQLDAGEIACLTGASGSGKSRLLDAIADAWAGPVVRGELGGDAERVQEARPAPRARSVLDVMLAEVGAGGPRVLDDALRLLCTAGLGEARTWLLPAQCLSAGQADRLQLALLYARTERCFSPLPLGEGGPPKAGRVRVNVPTGGALGKSENPATGNAQHDHKMDPHPGPLPEGEGEPVLLLIDEFASRLDRLTARILSANLRRWVDRRPAVAVVVASAHDDLPAALSADRLWVKQADAGLSQVRMTQQ